MRTYTTQHIERLVNAAKAASEELGAALNADYEMVDDDVAEEYHEEVNDRDKVLDELNVSLNVFEEYQERGLFNDSR